MKPFETSYNTRRLIAAFASMSLGDAVKLIDMSRTVGFDVTPANSYTARMIAEREHRVFVYLDRDRGFVRGNGSEMVSSGAGFLDAIKRKAKRCGQRMELALTQNLTRDEHLIASETLSRANIVASTSSPVAAKSNRAAKQRPQTAVAFDTVAALRAVK